MLDWRISPRTRKMKWVEDSMTLQENQRSVIFFVVVVVVPLYMYFL